ncbi:hypothetical protein CPB97_007978 [Podila verticillata]|nr:hypothetical protein CPB97_007978 [Podila verticillata]
MFKFSSTKVDISPERSRRSKMNDSAARADIDRESSYSTLTHRVLPLSLGDIDNLSPARSDLSSPRSGVPIRSLSNLRIADSDSSRILFEGSSSDDYGRIGGDRTSFQGSCPVWGFYEDGGSDEGNASSLVCSYDDDRDSDEDGDSDKDEPKGAQTNALSTVDDDRTISKLAARVLECALAGTRTGVIKQCVTVMRNVRRISREGSSCMCDHCFMEPRCKCGPVTRLNGSYGASAWGHSSGLVVGLGQTSPLIERTWKSVSILVHEWGSLVGSKLTGDDYRAVNRLEGGKSFSPAMAAGHQYAEGIVIMAIGVEGMLNGAGMYEHYPAMGDSVKEQLVHGCKRGWIDCAMDPPRRVVRPARERYACVSHTWGRGCCKGRRSCRGTGDYQRKHVCLWGKDWDEDVYWDERDIAAAVVAAGWKRDLWLDWADIPVQEGWDKTNTIKARASLYAEADRVYVFVPESDFDSITEAVRLSETATTCDDFVKVIRQLADINWFASTWTLLEMFLSYERMEVVTFGGKVIHCGWLGRLKDQLAALVDSCGAHLVVADINKLMALGVLHLGGDGGLMVVAALIRSGGKTHDCYDRKTHAPARCQLAGL